MIVRRVTISIPSDLDFSDLELKREPNGYHSFRMEVIERICEASNIDFNDLIEGPEDNIAAIIAGWYHAHRQAGGDPDPVAEELTMEVLAEDAFGAARVQPGSGKVQ